MAAQERAKQGLPKEPAPSMPEATPPPPMFDDHLLMSMDTEADAQAAAAAAAAPPAFDDMAPQLFPTPSPLVAAPTTMQWDPMAAPPAPSAPAMEDLFDQDATATATNAPVQDDWGSMQIMAPPPPMEEEQQPVASQQQQAAEEAMEAILGIEGMSAEEKQELIDEQVEILAAIEKSKSGHQVNAAAARADAFEQRSFSAAMQSVGGASGASKSSAQRPRSSSSASGQTVNLGSGQEVALHGQERTRQAIADGTAILVECLSCHNWMQVTESAALMFCPVCQVVSPVEAHGGDAMMAHSHEEAAQLKSDQELAEQLQKEEYKAVDRQERRQATRSNQQTAQEQQSQSWTEWLGLSSSATSTTGSPSMVARPNSQPPSFAIPAERPRERGELGVSRPPGSGPSPDRSESDTITFSSSYDEQDGLLGSGGGNRRLPAARMAQSQPLFSCVADSISSAANQAMKAIDTTAMSMSQDAEGNVHGVDSSGLLAVTNVGRETRYEQLDDRDHK